MDGTSSLPVATQGELPKLPKSCEGLNILPLPEYLHLKKKLLSGQYEQLTEP